MRRARSRPLRWLMAALLWLAGRRPRGGDAQDGQPPAGVPPTPVERELGPRRRAENAVLALLALTALSAAGFIVFYLAEPSTQLLGLAIGLALAFLAAAAIVTGKAVIPQETAVEERSEHADPEAQREVEEIVEQGGEGISRRRLLIGAAGTAGATIGAAALLPVASLGPGVGQTVYATPWRRGLRVVDENDVPIKADDVVEETFLTGFPEGASKDDLGSPIILVRIDPAQIELPADRSSGAPEGILAYSKICPHAGCAISIYQSPLYEPTEPPRALVCPCHYSTFDPARGGELLFGPAGRDLPQLPLAIAADRVLTAGGDFFDAIGPSYGGIRLDD